MLQPSLYSNNNPLTYILSTAKLNATSSRWVAELADSWFMRECSEELLPDTITATIQAVEVQKESFATWSYSVVSMLVAGEGETATASAPYQRSVKKGTQIWSGDRPFLDCRLSGSKLPVRESGPKTECLFREWDKLTINSDDILNRTTTAHKQLVLEELHNNMGHQGADRTISLVRNHVFWPLHPNQEKLLQTWSSMTFT